jgi:dienelactone hydrolase
VPKNYDVVAARRLTANQCKGEAADAPCRQRRAHRRDDPEYEAAGVSYTKTGVEHGFHNDTAGPRYNEAAAQLAWSRTVVFFKDTLAA